MEQNFESWLQEKFTVNHPQILDDDLPDAFDNWIAQVDQEAMMDWANIYGLDMYRAGIKHTEEIINKVNKKYDIHQL